MNASALQIALAHAARGTRILPLDPTSKVPLLPETAATTSETRIRHWWKQRPYAVPGTVVAGKVEPITSLPAPVAKGLPALPTPVSGVPVAQFGPLSKMADRAAEILLEAKVPFYQRGDKLVRPVIQPAKSFHGGSTTAAQLVEVEFHYLRDTLCQHSLWVKLDKRARSWSEIHPPPEAAFTLLKRFGDWKFPHIAGIINTPTLRPDGTVLSTPGYDAATQLLLVDPPAMPVIPERPSREEALKGLQLFKDLLGEFPFADAVSRAVALSALISTVCRGAYPVLPMHVTEAPVAASGKSYLLNCVSWIATGQAMPVLGTGKSEEETEKRVGAALIKGQALICLDNVVGELGGDALCRLIEQPRPSVRVLGHSQNVEVDAASSTYFANGNNIVIVGDLCRRVVRCRLDPRLERPELREFKGDPRQIILANRGTYIAAALTICRAYIAAGRPNRLPQLASFGEWSDTVRSALTWLGEADPVASMDMSQADDPEKTALEAVLREWAKEIGTGEKKCRTLKQVTEMANAVQDYNSFTRMVTYAHPGLRAAIQAVMPNHSRQQPNVEALGQWMRGKKDRRLNGLWFDKKPGNRGEATVWWVEGQAQTKTKARMIPTSLGGVTPMGGVRQPAGG